MGFFSDYWNESSQRERRDVVKNDRQTYLDRAVADANVGGGRYATLQKQTVIGAKSGPTYPRLPASSPWSDNPDKAVGARVDQDGFEVREPTNPLPEQPSLLLTAEASRSGSLGAGDNGAPGPEPVEHSSGVSTGSPTSRKVFRAVSDN